MSLSWQFHGTFTYKPYLGTVCQNLLEKLSKKSVLVVDLVFCLISASFLAICQIHVGFMALSWHFHGAFFLLIFIVFPNSFMALACQIHGRFMALSWRFHGSFFQSQKIKIMSDSCHFHGSFMALSHTSLTWVQSAKIYWKSYPKSRCWLSICLFCLISASFLAICQVHVGFMALSWHFLPSFFLNFFLNKIQTNNWIHLKNDRLASMSDSSRIHRGFMALSCHFHGTFLSASQLCRIHRGFITFMAVSWHFHIQALPGYSLPKSIGKVIQKVGVGCRFVFFA